MLYGVAFFVQKVLAKNFTVLPEIAGNNEPPDKNEPEKLLSWAREISADLPVPFDLPFNISVK